MSEPLKCVFVISSALGFGQALNCSALLAANLGAQNPELIGEAPLDADGKRHSGLCSLPISILQASPEILTQIASAAEAEREIRCFDVTTISQRARKYSDVVEWTRETPSAALEYVGFGLLGPKSKVVKLTGTLQLYR